MRTSTQIISTPSFIPFDRIDAYVHTDYKHPCLYHMTQSFRHTSRSPSLSPSLSFSLYIYMYQCVHAPNRCVHTHRSYTPLFVPHDPINSKYITISLSLPLTLSLSLPLYISAYMHPIDAYIYTDHQHPYVYHMTQSIRYTSRSHSLSVSRFLSLSLYISMRTYTQSMCTCTQIISTFIYTI